MFGLVDQNYELPEEVIKEIGVYVFDYETFRPDSFAVDTFDFDSFEIDTFDHDGLDITFLRRGVIGVSKVGYVA